MGDPGRLSPEARAAIADPANSALLSAASVWEIAIKVALGRLRFPLDRLGEAMAEAGFEELPIRAAHAVEAGAMPRHHADPFDRMLVAQARVEGLVLVSEDRAVAAYGVRLLGRGG